MDPRLIGGEQIECGCDQQLHIQIGNNPNTLYLSPYSDHNSHTINPPVFICLNYETSYSKSISKNSKYYIETIV